MTTFLPAKNHKLRIYGERLTSHEINVTEHVNFEQLTWPGQRQLQESTMKNPLRSPNERSVQA